MSKNEQDASHAMNPDVAAPDLNFIVDAPASQDELDAHSPIAAAITSVVKNADRIKMIGIIGGWGSGKSTVAQLAKLELEQTPSAGQPVIRCFTFDAWQHQSDPPRRAFLEALAQYLETDKAFIDLRHDEKGPTPEWKAKLEDLRVLTEKTTTTSTPTLTPAGRVLAVSAIGVPIGLRLIGDGTLSPEDQRDLAAVMMFVLAWLLAIGPLIVIASFYLFWRPWRSALKVRGLKTLWKFLRHHKDSRAKDSIISLVANKAEETRTDVRKKTPDPTAIEFQDAFRDMVAVAHTAGRRLVLIVDNLDRLPADEAKTIWATVRSLFLGTDAKRVIKREDLPTVIMPIDASSIEKMYGAEEGLSRSFLEKTFDLVFHVPTPVLSRWHRYMHDKLRSVFKTALSDNDISNVRSVYERKLGTDKPTPRSINNFINSVATLWLQRYNDNINIAIVAYYVTERDDFLKSFDNTLEHEVDLLDTIDVDWRTAVAALHSGLTRADADELFMDGPIRSAIQSGDPQQFKALTNRPGFDRYFIRVLSKPVEDQGGLKALTAAALLGEQDDKPWMPEAWNKLRKASLEIDANTQFGDLDYRGINYLVDSAAAGPERVRYLEAMSAALGRTSGADLWRDRGAPYGRIVRELIGKAHEADLANFEIVVPGGAGRFYQMLQQDFPEAVLRALSPTSGDIQELIPFLADRLVESEFHQGVATASAALARRSGEIINWEALTNAVEEALASGDEARQVSGAETLIALYPLIGLVRERALVLKDDGLFRGVWNTFWAAEEEGGLTRLAALMIAVDGPVATSNSQSWDDRLAKSPELPNAIGATLEEMNVSRDLIWLMSRVRQSPSDAPLMRGLAGRLIEQSTFAGADTAVVLDDVAAFNDLAPLESRSRFWQTMAARADFWSALDGLGVRNRAEVLHILALSLSNRSRLGRALKSHLENYDKSDWEEALQHGNDAYPFLADLEAIGSTIRLGTPAYGALRDTIATLLATDDEAYRDRWFKLAERVKAELRRTLLNMLSDAINSGVSVPHLLRVLTAGGPDLIDRLGYQADRSVLRVVSVLAEAEDGLVWLTDNSETIQRWLEKSTKDTRFTLAEQMKATPNNTTASALYAALGLQKEFG